MVTQAEKLLLLFALVVFVMGLNNSNYTRICEMHTMNIYQGYGRRCKSWQHSGVQRAEDKQKIVTLHNNYRRKVAMGVENRGCPGPQPGSSNMLKLAWDPELAKIAQRWAQQCIFGHDECRNVARFGWVGQNVYISSHWSSKGVVTDNVQDWDQAITAFYDEVKYFHNLNVKSFNCRPSKNKTGHYTQLLWAKTSRVGCGFISYMNEAWYQKYYVCNYGPGGNILEETMYMTGPNCSACSSKNNCDQGLCV